MNANNNSKTDSTATGALPPIVSVGFNLNRIHFELAPAEVARREAETLAQAKGHPNLVPKFHHLM